MQIKSHTYNNDKITILWQPDKCIHSGVCVRELPAVFNTGKSPWIDMSKAETEIIAEQVGRCPSGALSLIRVS